MKGNGWNDIGYNFLVDKYGQVFEGRYGGVERNVIGAHAEGFNTGSVGIALLGNVRRHEADREGARRNRRADRLAAGRRPCRPGLAALVGLRRQRALPVGTPVPLRCGHRPPGHRSTSCPGNALLRAAARDCAQGSGDRPAEALLAVRVAARLGGLVRFTARLSAARPWTVRVTDTSGAHGRVRHAVSGASVDWTWDATFAAPTGYTYSIEAGADVRPAIGTIGQVATSLTMTGAQAKPATFTPNGDSQADSTVISYTLSLASTVTATLRDASGATLATLFVEQKKAGRQSFKFTATGVADGRYSVVLNAKAPSGREANAVVPIVVDRTLAAFVGLAGGLLAER